MPSDLDGTRDKVPRAIKVLRHILTLIIEGRFHIKNNSWVDILNMAVAVGVPVDSCSLSPRTHTIDLRRFMRELGFDAHLQDKLFRKSHFSPGSVESKDSLRRKLFPVLL